MAKAAQIGLKEHCQIKEDEEDPLHQHYGEPRYFDALWLIQQYFEQKLYGLFDILQMEVKLLLTFLIFY